MMTEIFNANSVMLAPYTECIHALYFIVFTWALKVDFNCLFYSDMLLPEVLTGELAAIQNSPALLILLFL